MRQRSNAPGPFERITSDFFKDAWRRPAAGGYPNRLWARTRTLVAAAAVAGLALLGPRITAANTGVCSVGEPSTFTRFVCRSSQVMSSGFGLTFVSFFQITVAGLFRHPRPPTLMARRPTAVLRHVTAPARAGSPVWRVPARG